ncbi:hypothetical protein PSET11_00493 [Arthrobacter ulcerisalmonis]|uniref:DUF1990 domain-containing protein n=1 Tax=Arthrobacter ulcerisalmonis TaxID=2483813 RepID=A0A3P5WE13_9MICC|nr:DUF1990 domain-containing protein [Arthrobacter ulcerisalmonis]VDC18729.1 hypothetical protein PSET11_00493 [Arthrobacter ulcerisalmonis]
MKADAPPPAGRLNYPGVGGTEHGVAPAGFNHVLSVVELGNGAELYQRVAAGILGWELQRRAGLRVQADSPVAIPGARVVSGFGVGPFRLNAPCEVVWVRQPTDQPGRAGFGYGTLPGHPASGEESFEVVLADTGAVTLQIRAFSRPANWFYTAGAPVTAAAQRHVTARYIEGALSLSTEGHSL